jgi:hypothetical protein
MRRLSVGQGGNGPKAEGIGLRKGDGKADAFEIVEGNIQRSANGEDLWTSPETVTLETAQSQKSTQKFRLDEIPEVP